MTTTTFLYAQIDDVEQTQLWNVNKFAKLLRVCAVERHTNNTQVNGNKLQQRPLSTTTVAAARD